MPVWLAIFWLPWPVYAALLVALIVFGIWICGESARLLGVHDAPGIVFDEIAGFAVAATPLIGALHSHLPLWLGLPLAFGLFRLFDIWKPWPIRQLDAKVHGGFGIMLDDLVAGRYAAATLYAAGQIKWGSHG